MTSQQQLSSVSKLLAARQKLRAQTSSAELLLHSAAEGGRFVFCLHSYLDRLAISAWIHGGDMNKTAMFDIDPSSRIIVTKQGEYSEIDIAQMRGVIEKWMML